jgi:cell division protease FtsH
VSNKWRTHLWYILAALVVLMLFQSWYISNQQIDRMDYSEFRQLLEEGRVESVQVSENHIVGELKQPQEAGGPTRFETTRVPPDIAEELEQYGVTYDGRVETNFFSNLLSWLIPIALLVGVWWFLIRRMVSQQGGMGGMMQVGKSKAKIYVEEETGADFDDVAGVEEAKHELQETVNFLKSPEKYRRLGARQPKGILLVGPPGTGKTLLARAVAGEADVPFFSLSGSEFVEMFVGVGASRVRDLFAQAKEKAPCIVFIDELDALGKARQGGGGTPGGGHEEKEQTLNQLLDEMDGFDPRTGIVVLAATNQPQVLDPALMRAGRFDRQVMVDKPDKKGRLQILKVHARDIEMAEDVDLERVAALTAGFSGADLENLVNEAAIVATRRDAEAVTLDDFTRGIERLVAGLEKKSRVLSDFERNTVAHHEMGHAIVAWVLPGAEPVHKVSIIPRGIGALGYTLQRPTEDRYLMAEEEIENRMTVLFGGRAAEELIFGRATTGAADDFAKATDMARDLVTRYGMDETLGRMTYEDPRRTQTAMMGMQERKYAEETAREIDCAVKARLDAAFDRAYSILETNRALLERAAGQLLDDETLEEEALHGLLKDAHLPEPVAEERQRLSA